MSDQAQANETLAQRVAEILAGKMKGPQTYGSSLGQPARVVGHGGLKCRNCGETRSADHPGPAGGCKGHVWLSHDFHGTDTVITPVDALESHHAIYVDGTVSHPA
jgi:hypothetical protein